MAKKDKEKSIRIPSVINKLAKTVQDNIDKLYQNTYFSSPSNKKDLNDIKTGIDKSIDDIITNNYNNVGMAGISKLYLRLGKTQKDKSIAKSVEELFDDKVLMDTLMTTYMQNSYLKDLDNEIDVVCKYMPKLLEALDTRKDNVLSSDHFTKDFINVSNDSNVKDDTTFNKNIEDLKDKYDLAELFDNSYDDAAKYGEQFVYIVPYKKALAKLLANKGNTTINAKTSLESGQIIYEDTKLDPYVMKEAINKSYIQLDTNYNINIELNNTNMISSVVESLDKAYKKYKLISESSLNLIKEEKITIDKGITNDLDYSNFEKSISSSEGLFNTTNSDKLPNIDIPGCIVKRIPRENIIPIYIENLCLGYYYLEFKENDDFFKNSKMADPIIGLSGSSTMSSIATPTDEAKRDKILKYISGQLSSFIDSKFINQNQDLRKEIYMILKHNDLYNMPSTEKLKVTFLPAEDVTHIYFKKDEKTNRGISDLVKALFPAKLYSSLYVTNSMTIMTRGQDKRVYYVKQNIDTNIAKVLLNTIDQIKKSNFGIRQIENMNNILNITGKFNDYVIPVGPNGDSPVQFEVMQGQNVEIKTDLMNMLEEMAINSTDVPLELIQARQSIDYALQLTMTNSKFLRKVYNRQAKVQKFYSEIITKIYNAEFEKDEVLNIMLPPPMFLNITNTNQIMDNTNALVQSIVDMEMADETDDKKKAIFAKNLKRHYLGSYLDLHAIDEIKRKSIHEAKLKENPGEEQ